MEKTIKSAKAQVLGKMAFDKGMKRVAALDADCMNLLKDAPNGTALPVMKAWNAGWDQANLSTKGA